MMLSEPDLMEAIFETALKGCDVNVSARKNALWNAAVCLLADVLRENNTGNAHCIGALLPATEV